MRSGSTSAAVAFKQCVVQVVQIKEQANVPASFSMDKLIRVICTITSATRSSPAPSLTMATMSLLIHRLCAASGEEEKKIKKSQRHNVGSSY